MKKEYSPELYNYNKYPGPVFVSFEDQVKSDEFIFKILENTGESFDAESFSQRFSEILLKYDYIVGDWGNEQLRLRGFYQDDRQKPSQFKISRLQDYLKEYCNFGCAYFVLENPEPRELVFEEEQERPKKRRRRKPANKRPRSADYGDDYGRFDKRELSARKKKSSRGNRHQQRQRRRSEESGSREHFTIRQKG